MGCMVSLREDGPVQNVPPSQTPTNVQENEDTFDAKIPEFDDSRDHMMAGTDPEIPDVERRRIRQRFQNAIYFQTGTTICALDDWNKWTPARVESVAANQVKIRYKGAHEITEWMPVHSPRLMKLTNRLFPWGDRIEIGSLVEAQHSLDDEWHCGRVEEVKDNEVFLSFYGLKYRPSEWIGMDGGRIVEFGTNGVEFSDFTPEVDLRFNSNEYNEIVKKTLHRCNGHLSGDMISLIMRFITFEKLQFVWGENVAEGILIDFCYREIWLLGVVCNVKVTGLVTVACKNNSSKQIRVFFHSEYLSKARSKSEFSKGRTK